MGQRISWINYVVLIIMLPIVIPAYVINGVQIGIHMMYLKRVYQYFTDAASEWRTFAEAREDLNISRDALTTVLMRLVGRGYVTARAGTRTNGSEEPIEDQENSFYVVGWNPSEHIICIEYRWTGKLLK